MASKDVPVYQKHTALIYTVINPASDIPSIEGLVMRDLPPEIPQKIQRIIQKKFNGSLPEFALANGLKHSTVYSVLCRGNRRKLQTMEAMAAPLGTDVDFLAQILLIDDVEKRKLVLDKLQEGMSLRQWAVRAGISHGAIRATINTQDQAQLLNIVNVTKALGLSLQEFADVYSDHTVQTA